MLLWPAAGLRDIGGLGEGLLGTAKGGDPGLVGLGVRLPAGVAAVGAVGPSGLLALLLGGGLAMKGLGDALLNGGV